MSETEKMMIKAQLSEYLFDKSMPNGLKGCRVFVMENDNFDGIWELKKSELLSELVEATEGCE
jgi:predicted metal-binding transcription factor (methanogenesis marker protein 9)